METFYLLEQSWVLQESNFSLKPEQDPPLCSGTVLYLVDFWFPPPQLLEQHPVDDQGDHWQLAEKDITLKLCML